jgi:hypothetical protein
MKEGRENVPLPLHGKLFCYVVAPTKFYAWHLWTRGFKHFIFGVSGYIAPCLVRVSLRDYRLWAKDLRFRFKLDQCGIRKPEAAFWVAEGILTC